jgi:hypothetical protein
MRKFYTLLLLILFSSCEKQYPLQDELYSPTISSERIFNDNIHNSVWILESIEFQNQKLYYDDTVEFLQDTILVYNGDTSSYEFYNTSKNIFQLRLTLPVGYVYGDLNLDNLAFGRLNHHIFYNFFILSNKYYINMYRLK